jgi:hypothetical protein
MTGLLSLFRRLLSDDRRSSDPESPFFRTPDGHLPLNEGRLFMRSLVQLFARLAYLSPDLFDSKYFFPVFSSFLRDVPSQYIDAGVLIASFAAIFTRLNTESARSEMVESLWLNFDMMAHWADSLKKAFIGSGLRLAFHTRPDLFNFPFQSLLYSTLRYDPKESIVSPELNIFWRDFLGRYPSGDWCDAVAKLAVMADSDFMRRRWTTLLCQLINLCLGAFKKYEYYSPFLILLIHRSHGCALQGFAELMSHCETWNYLRRAVYAMIVVMQPTADDEKDYLDQITSLFFADRDRLLIGNHTLLPLVVHCLRRFVSPETARDFVEIYLIPGLVGNVNGLNAAMVKCLSSEWIHWILSLLFSFYETSNPKLTEYISLLIEHDQETRVEQLKSIFLYCDLYESQSCLSYRVFKRELLYSVLSLRTDIAMLMPIIIEYLFFTLIFSETQETVAVSDIVLKNFSVMNKTMCVRRVTETDPEGDTRLAELCIDQLLTCPLGSIVPTACCHRSLSCDSFLHHFSELFTVRGTGLERLRRRRSSTDACPSRKPSWHQHRV